MKSARKNLPRYQLPNWSWRTAFFCGGLFFFLATSLFSASMILDFLKLLPFSASMNSFLILYLIAPVLGWYFFFYRYHYPVGRLIGKINLVWLLPMLLINALASLFFLFQAKYPEAFLLGALLEMTHYQSKIDLLKIIDFLKSLTVVPVMEEFLFRGVIFLFLVQKFGSLPAILFSSVLFASFHYGFYGSLVTGLLAAILFWRTKSLLNSIVLHFSSNFLAELIWFFPLAFTQTLMAIGKVIPYLPALGTNPLESLAKSIFHFP